MREEKERFNLMFTIRDWEKDTQSMIDTIEKVKKQYPDAEIAVEAQFLGNA